jgi:hypothetical protein
MDSPMRTWDYRLVKKKGLEYYGVIEVYYDLDGEVRSYSDFIPVCGASLEEVKADLERFKQALEKPILLEEDLEKLHK